MSSDKAKLYIVEIKVNFLVSDKITTRKQIIDTLNNIADMNKLLPTAKITEMDKGKIIREIL